MSRWIGLFPTIAAFAAFILSILCLFAGTQNDLLSSVDILTVCQSARELFGEAADRMIAVHTLSWKWSRRSRFLFDTCDVLLRGILELRGPKEPDGMLNALHAIFLRPVGSAAGRDREHHVANEPRMAKRHQR